MKLRKASIFFLFFFLFSLRAVAQPEKGILYQVAIAVANPDSWQVERGKRIILKSPVAGILSVEYKNLRPHSRFSLLLRHPVRMPAGIQHLYLWLHGKVNIEPIVIDKSREKFVYKSYSQGSGWQYVSTYLIDPYQGGRIRNRGIAVYSGGNRNGIPDYPLKLAGFEIKTGNLSNGQILLKDIAFDRTKQSDNFFLWGLKGRYLKDTVKGAKLPFLFSADICQNSGNYEVSWRVWTLTGTRLLKQGEEGVRFNSKQVARMSQRKVIIPFLTQGTYILGITVIDKDAFPGMLGARKDYRFRLDIVRGDKAALKPLPLGVRPLAEYIRINSRRDSFVYQKGERKVVEIRFWKPESAGPYRWSYWWQEAGRTIRGKGQKLDFTNNKGYIDKEVELRDWEGRNNPTIKFEVRLRTKTKTLAQKQVVLGFSEGLPSHPKPLGKGILNLKGVLTKYGNLLPVGNYSNGIFTAGQRQFEKWANALIDAGYKEITLVLNWKDLNPLPGVYDFRVLDKRVAYLNRKNIPFSFRFAWGFDNQPDFVPDELMVDQSGNVLCWQGNGKALHSPFGPGYRRFIKDYVRQVIAHYRHNPDLIGYEFLGIASDWLLGDRPYIGMTTDFSPSARAAFQRYLQKVKGYSLKDINRRYGKSYNSFAQIPLPDLFWNKDHNKPDLRPEWIDFAEFKQWLGYDYTIDLLAKTIRKWDERRFILMYLMGGAWQPLEAFKQYGIIGANGGAEREPKVLAHYSQTLQHKLYERGESVSTRLSQPFRLEQCAFNMLSAGKYGALLYNFWSVNNPVYAGKKGEDQKEFLNKWFKIYRLLKDSQATLDKVGLIASPDYLFYQVRTAFGAGSWFPGDYKFVKKIYQEEGLHPSWISEQEIGGLKNNRLIIALGLYSQILEGKTINALLKYVKGGGVLVLDTKSGDYSPQYPEKSYVLWRRLGLPVPEERPQIFERKIENFRIRVGNPEPDSPFRTGDKFYFSGESYLSKKWNKAKPLLSRKDGNTIAWELPYGKGRLIVFTGALDYEKSSPFIARLYEGLGGKVAVKSSAPDILSDWLQAGRDYYLLVHRYRFANKGFNRQAIRARGKEGGRLRLLALKEGNYTVEYLNDKTRGREVLSARQLREQGLRFELFQAQTEVVKITRVENKNNK